MNAQVSFLVSVTTLYYGVMRYYGAIDNNTVYLSLILMYFLGWHLHADPYSPQPLLDLAPAYPPSASATVSGRGEFARLT
jgi:hypothetical protein